MDVMDLSVYKTALWLAVLGSMQYVANTQALQYKGCSVDITFKDSLSCYPDVLLSAERSYIPEHTHCGSKRGDVCYVCQEHTMVEVECQYSRPQDRHKRGFFKKAFRKLRPKLNPFKAIRKPINSLRTPFKRLNLGGFKGLNFGGLKGLNFGGFKGLNFGGLKGLKGLKFKFPIKIVNAPPTITCPKIPSVITAPRGQNTAKVTWAGPQTHDKENSIRSVQLTTGKASGSRFGPGRHTVSYKVTDGGGLVATCSVSFTVKVIRCPPPKSPANGGFHCSGNVGTVYGSTCTYRCNSGHELSGTATVTCHLNGAFSAPPTCKKIQCEKLALPAHAKAVTCTDGQIYQSVCMPSCIHGYMPTRGAKSVCTQNKKWLQTDWKCEDTVKPVFLNCPTKKINTIDKKFRWDALKATDNSGKVTVTQVQGQPAGSILEFGIHLIKYVANDTSGNTAFCVFTVELKKSDCSKPLTDDQDMKFTCNGLTAQSVCLLSCESGSYVQGSKYIACVQDENNTAYWEPVHGEKARCYKKTCPTLNAPKNGALACDRQLGGTVCQIQCDDRYDVASGDGNAATYICSKNSQIWKPRNAVPDCLEMAFPDEYFLPTEFFYFLGDCSNEEALREIKQQFIDNLNSIGLSPCMSDACSVDDIDVSCGDSVEENGFDFRRKRRAVPNAKRVVHIRLTFHLKNSNRTIAPEAAKALLQSLAEKSKKMMSTNTVMRKMLFKTLKPTLPPISSKPRGRFIPTVHRKFSFDMSSAADRPVSIAGLPDRGQRILPSMVPPTIIPPNVRSKSITGNLSMECATGHVQLKSKPGICVPCSVGTYQDTRSESCRPCPVNTHQSNPGSTSCQACSQHYITTATGATSKGDCIALCGKDTFSSSGNVPCFPCPTERYQTAYGAKTCIPCPMSKAEGQGPSKCDNIPVASQNVTLIPPEFQISQFLLTCDEEVCLSF